MTMDRKIEKKKLAPWQWGLIAVLAAAAIWFIYQLLADASIRTYRVPQEHIIVSTVEFGAFEVDLEFEGPTPANIRRGQTLQMELTLGNPVESLLVPLGGFIQDTGGNWIFVLDSTGEYALRRDIRVGRRNNRYVEVREGLAQGDRVITSSYSQMEDMERIQLTQ